MSTDSPSAGADVLDRLDTNLRAIGSVVPERSAGQLRVPATQPDGFDVTLLVEEHAFMVGFGAFFFPFWRRRSQRTLRNHLLTLEQARSILAPWS